MLKPELYRLLNYLDGKPRVEELGLITNGLCIDQEVMKKLSRVSKLKKVKVSLDGADPEIHDAIRRKGAFERVLETLSMLIGAETFEVILMLTVMRKNYRNLPAYLSLMQEVGADGLILERFIPWGRGRERMDQVLSKGEWYDVVKIFSDFFSAEIDENRLYSFQAFNVKSNKGEMELLGAPCVIGSDGLCVMPEGTLFPCRRFPVSMGNLSDHSLRQIWESSELLAALRKRENLKGKCGRCDMEGCRGCRSLALSLTGDYLAEDPHCWYQPNAPANIPADRMSHS